MSADWSLSYNEGLAMLDCTGNRAEKNVVRKAPDTTKIDTDIAVEDDSVLRSLVDEIAQQRESALGHLYDLTISRVYGTALRIVRKPELAEEAASDVYMQVWRDAVRYEPSRGRVLGWLLIMARTRALDLLRKQDEAFSHPDPHELIGEPPSNDDDPQDLLMALQSNTRLHAALEHLSPIQRQLLSLAFFRDLTHAEISVHLALPLGTVKTNVRRALSLLRSHLGE